VSGDAAAQTAGPATAWYVYGVVPAGTPAAAGARTGIASERVELVVEGDVAALAGRVPLDEFGEEPLRERLNDRSWLERAAQAHEEVLEAALAGSAVVPFRLATLYESEGRLREFLAERGPELAEILRRLDGKVELGVKAFFDRAQFVHASARSDEPASGRAYLVQRQLERKLDEEAAAFAAECAAASHDRIAAAAEGARRNPPQPPELSGRKEPMLLNGAYLVGRGERAVHDAKAELEERYGPHGVSYELTGPWPPYNFVPRGLVEP
jgi:hypothetical protein